MGKSKKRILAKGKNPKYQLNITRIEALKKAFSELLENPASTEARNLISLFGLKAEELSEMGLSYEILRSLDGFIN